MYASACLLLSLRCLVPHNSYSTQTRALSTTATAQYSYLTVIPLSYFLAQSARTMHKPQKLFPSLLLLLCGDISLNPGPVSASHSYPAAFGTLSAAATAAVRRPCAAAAPPPPPSLHIPRQTRSSNKTFLLYSLNIRSLLNPQNSDALLPPPTHLI